MGYFIVLLIAACVMIALAFYAYGPVLIGNALRSVYREIKHVIGTVARRGWRPLLPWVFIFVAGGIGWRVVSGLPLTVDVVQLVGVFGPLVPPGNPLSVRGMRLLLRQVVGSWQGKATSATAFKAHSRLR